MKESAIIISRIENVSSALGLEDRDMILRHVALTEEEKRNSLFFFVENDQMGDYYFESEDYDSAIEYYWKALAIVEFELGNDHCYISRELIKIAAAYNTKDEIQKAVEYLDEAGRLGFTLGITTALSRRNAEASLAHNGIKELFDCVITLEDLGNRIDKGSPDIFLRVTDYISASGITVTPGRALVFDDVPHALKGAKAGGFLTCAVYDNIGCGGPGNWDSFAAGCDFSVFKF